VFVFRFLKVIVYLMCVLFLLCLERIIKMMVIMIAHLTTSLVTDTELPQFPTQKVPKHVIMSTDGRIETWMLALTPPVTPLSMIKIW